MSDERIKVAELLSTSVRTLKIYAAQQKESGDTFTEKGLITIANDLQRLDDYLRSAPDARLREAVAKLLSLQIGFMPQCHKGHVVGEEYEGRKQAILDGMSGFFTEAYLYPLFGKETARTILAIEHELRAALSETKAVCEWVSITNGRQQTSCGKIVPMINPTGLAMNFYPAGQPTNCLYCGLPISVKEK